MGCASPTGGSSSHSHTSQLATTVLVQLHHSRLAFSCASKASLCRFNSWVFPSRYSTMHSLQYRCPEGVAMGSTAGCTQSAQCPNVSCESPPRRTCHVKAPQSRAPTDENRVNDHVGQACFGRGRCPWVCQRIGLGESYPRGPGNHGSGRFLPPFLNFETRVPALCPTG